MRKNIFMIINESFNIQSELRKLNEIFTKYNIFSNIDNKVTFKTYMNRIFPSWVGAGTCISLDEFLTTVRLYDVFPVDEKKLFETAQHNLEIHINMIEYMTDYTYNNKKNFINHLNNDNINMYKRLISAILDKISSKYIIDSKGLYYVVPIDNEALVVAESAVNEDIALSVLMFLHSSSQGNLEKRERFSEN